MLALSLSELLPGHVPAPPSACFHVSQYLIDWPSFGAGLAKFDGSGIPSLALGVLGPENTNSTIKFR
jgi:hypothetical protein